MSGKQTRSRISHETVVCDNIVSDSSFSTKPLHATVKRLEVLFLDQITESLPPRRFEADISCTHVRMF